MTDLTMLRTFVGLTLMLAGLVAACERQVEQSPPGSPDTNLELAEQWFEEVDRELSLAVLDRWLTSDFVSHDAATGESMRLEGYRESLVPFFSGFSNVLHVIRESVSEGDRIALLVDISMDHTGEFAGIAATGRTVNVSEMLILRFEGDRIAEEWILFDSANLLRQLQE